MSVVSKSFSYGQHSVTIDTGEIARQAEGAVRVAIGDTVVLVTACAQQTPSVKYCHRPAPVRFTPT